MPGTAVSRQRTGSAVHRQGLALYGLAFYRHRLAVAEPLDALVVGYGTPPDSTWPTALEALCRALP